MATQLLTPQTACLACVAGLISVLSLAARAATPASGAGIPGIDQLPSIKELPDPFLMKDGTRVRTKADWERRRGEIKGLILAYEYGFMPPAPGAVQAKEEKWTPPPPSSSVRPATGPAAAPVELPAGTTEKQYRLMTGPGGKIFTHLIVTTPPGKGPFPVIVKGDLCWGRVTPAILADVVKRGYVLAEFDRTEIAPDNNDRSIGVYPHYPDYDWRGESAWAWGYHRVIDYLLTRDDVDAKRIVVTGHSRGGKAAQLAGALDERVALTCPNGSGAGGAGAYRHQAAQSEDLRAIVTRFPFWFSPQFTQFIGHVDQIPFDHHEIKALVAPRAYLSTEALGDLWANPEGTQVAHFAAKEVFHFLGAAERIGIHYREGKHDQNEEDFAALLEFADHVFFGKPTRYDFSRAPFPNAPKTSFVVGPGGPRRG